MSDDDAKRALRREVSARIAQINQHARAFRAQRATDYALRSSALVHAKLVLSYRAMSDEINADALTMHLCARGVRIAFPCVDARQKLVLLGRLHDITDKPGNPAVQHRQSLIVADGAKLPKF